MSATPPPNADILQVRIPLIREKIEALRSLLEDKLKRDDHDNIRGQIGALRGILALEFTKEPKPLPEDRVLQHRSRQYDAT